MEDEKHRTTGVAYVFGPFRLVPDECLLLREGEAVPLTPQAFDLLRLLAESAGHLKSREELIKSLWPTSVVEENNLPWYVSALRKALDDDSESPRYIKTVRGRGYRFIAPVEIEGAGQSGQDSKYEMRRRWLWVAAVGLVAAAVVAVALVVSWPKFFRAPPTATNVFQRPSVAVLPFENLNVDKQDAYFVAGMQDLILTKLADIGDLKVISRTSTENYQSHPDDLKTIARQLGVSTILEGSVQKAGNQVLIDVQLIDVETGAHIWAQTYQRTLANVFGVEGEVAEKIATALNTRLTSSEAKRLATALTNDPVANDLFLRAEYLSRNGAIHYDFGMVRQAISTYKKAVAKAPDFALAWARLSLDESLLAWVGSTDVKTLEAQARADAEHALKLAPNLAAAYIALGYSDYWGRGDYAEAQKSFSAALVLRPGDADALAALAYIKRREGHFKSAVATLQQASNLDPRNSNRAWGMGQTYMTVGRYADAERSFQRALALNPENVMAKRLDARAILLASGNIPDALAAAQGSVPFLELERVEFLTDQGRYRQALALLNGIPDTADNFPPYRLSKAMRQAELYRRIGDSARAVPLFQQALAEYRAQVNKQHGENLASIWQDIAAAEIGLGRNAQALQAIARAWAVFAKTGDRYMWPSYMVEDAELYADAGRADLAVPLLARALRTPGISIEYSPALLWIDPDWDLVRNDPRFQALLKKYAKYKPAKTATTSAT